MGDSGDSSASTNSAPSPLLKKAHIDGMQETAHRHRLNPNAVRHAKSLGQAAGMSGLGVHLVRVEPGKDSTEYHFQHHEEEFVYILSGRGETDTCGEKHEVAPGDFMGFAAPGPPHVMRNPSDEDLVYLVGGQSLADDVTEYPRIGKVMYKVRGERHVVKMGDIEKVWTVLVNRSLP